MKRFLVEVLTFWGILFITIGGLRLFWIFSAPCFQEKGLLQGHISTLLLGPSNGECAWNDAIISNSKNLCISAMTMGGCFNRLKWVVEYNPVQIDTVVLCASWVALAYQCDDDLPIIINGFTEEKRNILNYQTFFSHYKKVPDYWKRAFTFFPSTQFNFSIEGGYIYLERDELHNPEARTRIGDVINHAGGAQAFSSDYFRKHCSYQLENLLKIQDYCNQHQITLVLLSPPVYAIPNMVNDQGYRVLIREELGDSTLVADYSRFVFPDNSYYGDLEHLNHKGATYFSEHIAREGIKTQYAIDYCLNKSAATTSL